MKEPSWVFSVRGGQPGLYRYSTHREGLLAWSKWTIFQKKVSKPCGPVRLGRGWWQETSATVAEVLW